MGVGSIGPTLRLYEESDTFLSTDAGVTWALVRREPHKYEFGDQGGIIVAVNDEETVDFVSYSTDLGKTWCVSTSHPLPFRSRIRRADRSELRHIGNPWSSGSRSALARFRRSRIRLPRSSFSWASSRGRTRHPKETLLLSSSILCLWAGANAVRMTLRGGTRAR